MENKTMLIDDYEFTIGKTYFDRFNKTKEIIKDKFNIETIW